MYRKCAVRIFPTKEELELMDLTLCAEMLLTNMLLRNAVETWKAYERIPEIRTWFDFIRDIREGDSLFSRMDEEYLRGTAVSLYVKIRDTVRNAGPESNGNMTESFPPYYGESDWLRTPIRLWKPRRIVFTRSAVEIPGIGVLRRFDGAMPEREPRTAMLRWRQYCWWLEWHEYWPTRPAGCAWKKEGEDEEGNTMWERRRLRYMKEEGPSDEEPVMEIRDGCIASDCE